MDDLKFDPCCSSRANRGRPNGMFGADHPPWETEPVARILDSYETFGHLLELGEELRVLRASNDKDSDADADGANRRQKQKIGTQVKELVRAYDAALCHNVYDIVDDKLGRLLNAERVKSLNLSTPSSTLPATTTSTYPSS